MSLSILETIVVHKQMKKKISLVFGNLLVMNRKDVKKQEKWEMLILD